MLIPKFNSQELKVVGEVPSPVPGRLSAQIYDFPVSRKDAYIATMNKKPIWQITNVETTMFNPRIFPDVIARAFVMEKNKFPREKFGGKDMFGIDWEYIEVAGGSMVKPGKPLLSDASDWKTKIVWPDIGSWDWEGSAKENESIFNTDAFFQTTFFSGYFERLITFMDFEGAALALIDEEQKDDIKELLDKLTDTYIKIVDKFAEYFPAISGIYVHDDWGSQRAPFFSPDVCMEMIVPPMRKLTDHIHSKGLYADLHCCGNVERLVPAMIAAGWDTWSGMTDINDTHMLYEKYGDKLIIGVMPDSFDPAATSEEAQRSFAAMYLEKFAKPGKPSIVNKAAGTFLAPAFREELYKLSRAKFCE